MSQAEKQKNLGNDAFKAGNYAKAIEYYTYATELDPRSPVYFTNRSMCYFKMQEWAKSLRDADKSIALNANWVKGYYRAGMAQIELGQLKEALANLEKAAELEPATPAYAAAADDCRIKYYATLSKPEIVKLEGNKAFKIGEIDVAIQKYTEALKLCVGDDDKTNQIRADLYGNRAMCYQQRWGYSEVVDDCTECLKLVPSHVKSLVRRAQAYEALEKYKKSLDDFDRATLLSPSLDVAIKGSIRVRNILKKMGEL
jgi:tetratricopeptide (TPR) repeat protein